MSDRLAVLPQYLLPKQLLTRFAGVVAGFEGGALTHALIRWFVKRYQVNMAEAAESDITRFPTFNAFFTRALKSGVRPLASADLVCPVDGAVSQCGPILGDRIFQAKGHDYTAQALLGGDSELAQQFEDGRFATIYLSPRDYHRIHMPCDGRLTRMIHVPGDLFSVNPTTARGVPGLFARNERVVCLFDTPHGAMALVLVGATVVGSMATAWHGVVNPPRPGQVREWRYAEQQVVLRKGDEMGRFLLGSTVVLLFQRKAGVQWQADWTPAHPVQLGEAMASTAA
jgi:phosphatidylserine decarboxylase